MRPRRMTATWTITVQVGASFYVATLATGREITARLQPDPPKKQTAGYRLVAHIALVAAMVRFGASTDRA